jgi:hypothetical protein
LRLTRLPAADNSFICVSKLFLNMPEIFVIQELEFFFPAKTDITGVSGAQRCFCWIIVSGLLAYFQKKT